MKKHLIAIAILFGLSWIPLVGSFDYEAALCTALAGIILIPILAPKKAEKTAKSLAISFISAIGFWAYGVLAMFVTAWIRSELCDIWQGLSYQVLISFFGVMLASLVWGWISRLSGRSWIRSILYAAAVLLDLGFALFALYNWPPLVSFGQFFGFFAGSIYDESMDVMQALIKWRIGTSALCLCLFFAQTPHAGTARKILLPVLGLLLAAGNHLWLSESGQITPLGRNAIRESLWQSVGNESFTVHYAPKSKSRRAMNEEKYRILSSCQRDYDALKAFFNAEPLAPIDIWLYPDRDTKGRFIGAKNTSFSRVWKNEIHVVSAPPDSTLSRHEMAHQFAGSFGLPPLMIAGGMHIPAMGWVEGFAMAAEWPVNDYDLHTWSAAIFARKDIFHDIGPREILYGFWGLPTRAAYTLAGSWVQWFIDKYGIDTVKKLSQNLPGDFRSIIGISIDEAFEAWKSDLREKYAVPNAAELVPLAFGSSSIWTKHCARKTASANAAWYRCLEDDFCALNKTAPIVSECAENDEIPGNPSFSDLEKIYSFYIIRGPLDNSGSTALKTISNPVFSQFRPSMNEAYRQLQTDSEIIDASASQLRSLILRIYQQISTPDQPAAVRVIWQERRADMMFHAGYCSVAAIMYDAMMRQALPESMMRRLEIKRQAARSPQSPVSQAVRQWFFSEAPKLSLAMQFRHAPVIAYLDFVDAMNQLEFDRAHQALTQIFLYSSTQDGAARLTPRCWKQLLHWMPYL